VQKTMIMTNAARNPQINFEVLTYFRKHHGEKRQTSYIYFLRMGDLQNEPF